MGAGYDRRHWECAASGGGRAHAAVGVGVAGDEDEKGVACGKHLGMASGEGVVDGEGVADGEDVALTWDPLTCRPLTRYFLRCHQVNCFRLTRYPKAILTCHRLTCYRLTSHRLIRHPLTCYPSLRFHQLLASFARDGDVGTDRLSGIA